MTSDEEAGAREATEPSGGDATAGWWAQTPPSQPPSEPNGSGTTPKSGQPAWSWELPTNSGTQRTKWTSVRVALPLVFGLVIVVALLAGALGAALGISSERHHNGTSGPPIDASNLPSTTTPARNGQAGSLAGGAARLLPSLVEGDVSAGYGKGNRSGFVIR